MFSAKDKYTLIPFFLFLIGVLFLFCDCRFLAFCIENSFVKNTTFNNFLSVCYVQNTGAAFSVFEGKTLILILISLLMLCWIFYYIFKNRLTFKIIDFVLFAFLSAGILSNLYERIFYGYVVDYIKLSFIDFPVFNLADCYIVISAIIIIILNLKNIGKKGE